MIGSSFKDVLNQNTHGQLISDEQLKELQKCLLTCYIEILEACEKYDIRPFAQGGTLLGLIRHGGFIPWDDDFDLGMSRKDYDKFIKIFDEELSDRYILSAPQESHRAFNRFVQLYRKETEMETPFSGESAAPNMISIDIFPIDFAPNNYFVRNIKGMFCNFLMAIGGCVQMYETKSGLLKRTMKKNLKGRLVYRLRLCVGTIFSFCKSDRWFHIIDKAIRGKKDTSYATSATGRKHYLGEVVLAEIFYPLRRMRFEGIEMFVPNDPEGYLRNLYGDFMKIPPVEKREKHHIVKLSVLK